MDHYEKSEAEMTPLLEVLIEIRDELQKIRYFFCPTPKPKKAGAIDKEQSWDRGPVK